MFSKRRKKNKSNFSPLSVHMIQDEIFIDIEVTPISERRNYHKNWVNYPLDKPHPNTVNHYIPFKRVVQVISKRRSI